MLTCNQVAAKWLQIVLILSALAVIGVFGYQARIRKTYGSPLLKGL